MIFNKNRYRKPVRLKSGGTIGVFTPSEPLTESRLSRVESGIEFLESAGFSVDRAANYDENRYYMAGSVAQRLADFHSLLRKGEIHAMMASWGGKSAIQLLRHIDYERIRESRIPICAFSDGGVLLNAIVAQSKLICFYGPNVVGKLDETSYGQLEQISSKPLVKGSDLLAEDVATECIVPGKAKGVLFGGNLSTYITGISGTRFSPLPEEGIFFCESGSKTSQGLDSLLTALTLTPEFTRIKGMIIGHINIKRDEKWGDRTLIEIVRSVFGDGFPIVHAPVFGHAKLPNPMFPLGCRAELDSEKGRLVLLEGPLR